MSSEMVLLPRPQELKLTGQTATLSAGRWIVAHDFVPANLRLALRRIQRALTDYAGFTWAVAPAGTSEVIGLQIVRREADIKPEGYWLTIAPEQITLEARDEAGIFYGSLTLAQLLQQYGAQLPTLVIYDWPDFPRRGVMLDISRDKVPTLETLCLLVDELASWKINEFQLYTEHTFAYSQHPDVWAKASPLTALEIRLLSAYCRERFIDLVPNQNSFGHMHRWFEHEAYLPLAEAPEGFVDPWGNEYDYSFSLTPSNPDTMPFLAGLYDELLPNFSSPYFNVGCDETFDLGQGRSKDLCAEKGEGRVYLEFLLNVYKLVKQRGLTMQFWGDIIGNHPELVNELPKDVVALEWGYEGNHDFESKCRAFAASGIPFYVCPGTSSWTTIAGRTDNMRANIRSAVENGRKYGAIGVLNTDWGDWGHWQTYPISLPGFAYGAALSWAYEPNVEADLVAALNAFVFQDRAGVMGKLAYDLGNTYQQPGALVPNASILFWAYHMPLDLLSLPDVTGRNIMYKLLVESEKNLADKLWETLAYVNRVMAPLADAEMKCPDADLIQDEFQLTADMLKHGAKRLLLILGDSSQSKAALCAELEAIQVRYQAQWLRRNRPGGLPESLERMEKSCAAYRA